MIFYCVYPCIFPCWQRFERLPQESDKNTTIAQLVHVPSDALEDVGGISPRESADGGLLWTTGSQCHTLAQPIHVLENEQQTAT